MNLIDLFTQNLSPRQKQYEAIRAVAFGEGTLDEIALQYGYSVQSLRILVHRVVSGKQLLFPEIKRGPKKPHLAPEHIQQIIQLRRQKHLNSEEITVALQQDHVSVSIRTVERVLNDAGFPKLRRRTNQERGISKKGTLIPQRSGNLDMDNLKPFRIECQVAGVFFFLPYILESGLLDIVSRCALPQSQDIGNQQAALAMLLLKLIGNKRLSHMHAYDTDLGFGLFAGLNVIPKPSYMCSYSCRTEEDVLLAFQEELIQRFRTQYPALYSGKTINLDFHSIPHFGDESVMEKVWCGSRGKAITGVNTFFAQDGTQNTILYTRTDIPREEASEEILSFVDYWIRVKGVVDETLVFDSKLTRYNVLYELDQQNVKFITLRIRCQSLIDKVLQIPDNQWEKIYLPIPKRKYKHVKVYQDSVALIPGKKSFRQIIIKDHGRSEPTFIITNQEHIKTADILVLYAKRWHIENKFSELIKFFNLNSLSSPVMIRIHFDLLWTVIADMLYHLFAQDLQQYSSCLAPKLFQQFIDMPGQVIFDGNSFTVKIRKHGITPILSKIEKLRQDIQLPWLNNIPLRILWTA